MRHLSTHLVAALVAIDAANGADPSLIDGRPLALVQGERASVWLAELLPGASDELALAARGHHLKRWEVRRADFEAGRNGYLRWRRANKQHQASEAVAIASAHGFEPAAQKRISDLLLRRGLRSDPETQTLEDVACLVFLETQFEPMIERLPRDRLVGIVAKTLDKMSAAAISLADRIELSHRAAAILASAAPIATQSRVG